MLEANHSDPVQDRSFGMYDPSYDRDSCGVGFVADIKGRPSRRIVDLGIEILKKLEHRGAVGADPKTGDGAGILMQIPHDFFKRVTTGSGVTLPAPGRYGIGFIYLPKERIAREAVENIIEKVIVDEGERFLGWRDVPVDESVPGEGARMTLPLFRQCFIGASDEIRDADEFERKLYLIRRVIDRRIRAEHHLDRGHYYVPSFSCKTVNYKGMLLAEQLPAFYKDLNEPDLRSALAMIHMRFSTNTFPRWDLAHPFRMIAHNGEINTLRGNINWMAARQIAMETPLYGKDLRRMLPIVMEGQSDSACFDSVLELLVMSGRSLPHAIMMMIPEAWSKNDLMDPDRRAFYEYHATLMEPWDGPASVTFTDGSVIGATLDRNGLRPARYVITKDDLVIMASEAGTLEIDPESISKSGKLEPGRMFLIDLKQGRIVDDEEVKRSIVSRKPYREWVEKNMIRLSQLPDPAFVPQPDHNTIIERQRIFGYTSEDINLIMKPMAVSSMEPTGAMGDDAPLAVLSEKPQLLFRYFKQMFAQVTNPPIDPIREELVMELTSYIGPEGNLLDETPDHAHRLELEHPILTNNELEKIRHIDRGHFDAITINILFDPTQKHGMRNRLNQVCEESVAAIRSGKNLIILTDRGAGSKMAPIPSLLAVAGVHHYLIREGLRTKTGIIIESGEPREVSHFALLIGYGANGINPYLAFETLADLHHEGHMPELKDSKDARKNYIKSIGKGLFKIFSKMGISTLQSYCGAQIFEAVGLDSETVNAYFTGTGSRIEGLSLEMLEDEVVRRHRMAFDRAVYPGEIDPGGLHYFRKTGENHLYSPAVIHRLQHSTRTNDYKLYREYADLINRQEAGRITLRSLFELKGSQKPVPIEEVEPEDSILKRFSTGAISFGSISWEAHTSMAIAMNRIGGKSNTGEGGEDPIRFKPLENGDSLRSAIKQVASGRFGVTTNYLVNADDIQIKMAQGAKPGEGGQLPGHKVDRAIAKLRYSTPGVTLISPPPHHDIYSIEDLAQLIFDLKNVNTGARISVKLVSEVGVGTVAAGVAKAKADHILISGHDGGTGASPVSSIHNAGTSWELGLSETHQTLVVNGLRDRVTVAVDGKMMTGRDVVIAALLGAEEYGFSTTSLVTLGCIMMRKCHLNTCPVGVATQDPALRGKYTGNPEHLVNFMRFIARETREYMAMLGFRTIDEMIGRTDVIQPLRPHDHWKARGLDFSRVLARPEPSFGTGLYRTKAQHHLLDPQIDRELIKKSAHALKKGEPVRIDIPVRNTDRTVGAMLSGEIAKRYGDEGLPDGTIDIHLAGTAGQSFGAFVARGVTLNLTGMANDYVGKGLSGGRIVVRAPERIPYPAEENIIAGNTCLYGATSGELYINGRAGERFAVRNSGANAVVEGIGDHGCEYMTGGRVVVIGGTGRNFAAGMSGGIAYVWNRDGGFERNVNREMVDLDPLTDSVEADSVRQMVERHLEYTGSARAKEILADWDSNKVFFVKVIPGDYKMALQKLAEERSLELEESETGAVNG
jgi:glutamate synthase (NADPH/NADH) large chain